MGMHKYSLQPTTELKTPLQIHSKKNLCETVPFSVSLQACNPQFLMSAKADSKKNVSFECSEMVGSLPGKGL